jgi:hypothetical protein
MYEWAVPRLLREGNSVTARACGRSDVDGVTAEIEKKQADVGWIIKMARERVKVCALDGLRSIPGDTDVSGLGLH